MDKIQYWNNLYKENIHFSPVSEILLDLLNLKGNSVLDIGCGDGELLEQLQKRGFIVEGIDLSKVAINNAQHRLGKCKLEAIDFIDFKTSKKFDLIFINKVLAFAEDKEVFVKKALSLLGKKGMLVIITPVTFEDYKGMYTERMNSISVDEKYLLKILPDAAKIVSKRYFDFYGCEYAISVASQ